MFCNGADNNSIILSIAKDRCGCNTTPVFAALGLDISIAVLLGLISFVDCVTFTAVHASPLKSAQELVPTYLVRRFSAAEVRGSATMQLAMGIWVTTKHKLANLHYGLCPVIAYASMPMRR